MSSRNNLLLLYLASEAIGGDRREVLKGLEFTGGEPLADDVHVFSLPPRGKRRLDENITDNTTLIWTNGGQRGPERTRGDYRRPERTRGDYRGPEETIEDQRGL